MLSRAIRKTVGQIRLSKNVLCDRQVKLIQYLLKFICLQCRYSSAIALKNSLDTIERYNPDINAFISVNDSHILQEKAEASDDRKLKGK